MLGLFRPKPEILTTEGLDLRNGLIQTQDNGLYYQVKRTVPCKTSTMVKVIKDVNNYEKYLPFCQKSEISDFRHICDRKEEATGVLHIGYGPFSDFYTSKIVYDPLCKILVAENIEGQIFKSMSSEWKFKSLGENLGTEYSFEMKCEIDNPIYNFVAKQAFGYVSSMMVNSFKRRILEVEKTQ